MYQGSRRALFPATLLAFGGFLLGLLVAASKPPVATEEATPTVSTGVPWEPLSRLSPELLHVSTLLSSGAKQKPQQRVQLEALNKDTTRPAITRGLAAFALGISYSGQRNSAKAIESFRAPEIEATELGGYALHYLARDLESRDPGAALDALGQLESRFPEFAQIDAARLRYARLLNSKGERDEAVRILKRAARSNDEKLRGDALDEVSKVLVQLGRYQEAVEALETLYYELPRHARASNGGVRLTRVRKKLPEPPPAHLYELQFKRAELLMEKGRYGDAYNNFASILKRYAKVADTNLVRLRMATCQYRRRQLTASLVNFKKVQKEELVPESLFYQSEVARRKRRKDYPTRVAELVNRFPKSRWTEAGLFSLADYHASNDEPDAAYGYYRHIVAHFPRGEHYVESRWKVLFELFRSGRYEEAAFGFEETAREQPGADELPRFLYWAGRAYQEAGRFDRAEPLFRQVLLGYQNTYYGRRALEHLSQLKGQRASLAAIEAAREGIDLGDALAVQRGDIQRRIAQLLAVGLVESALGEAKTAVQGKRDDAAFLAMAAWIHSDQKRNLQAIITIREAFPFYVSATGDLLPRPIWELFYPLPYWEPVERLSVQRGLNPYLVAALIRQESTFNPRVRSRAGARGLMQIMPATGRNLARQERRKYNLAELYNPESNILYGTRYLKEVLERFNGRVDYALAGYNAGPHRVKGWTGMDMTIDPEVFIEDIPFDETRGYVKLVLRNEMLYRRLYAVAEVKAAAE